MKGEAERKARRRQGFKSFLFEVQLATFICALVAEGLLAEKDIENDSAIREAGNKWIAQRLSLASLLQTGLARPHTKRAKRTALNH